MAEKQPSEEKRRDDILRRMLGTPPKPHAAGSGDVKTKRAGNRKRAK